MMTECAPTLYKNGSLVEKGQSVWGVATLINRAPTQFGSTFIVYITAGEYIQPGYWQTTAYSASGNMTGDASGYQTHFSVALLNKSLL